MAIQLMACYFAFGTSLKWGFLMMLLLRYNYLNDLPSLDPELYRHLIFLKVMLPSPVSASL